jgi:hypothetical protein
MRVLLLRLIDALKNRVGKANRMKTRLFAIFVLVMVGMIGTIVPAQATPMNVCASGCAFTSIQNAVDAARPGATIDIGSGSYAGGISIDKSLNLRGAGLETTVIKGGGPVVSVAAGTSVRITGLTVTGGYAIYGGGIANSGDLELQKSSVNHNTGEEQGGGIFNEGTLRLFQTIVTDNTVDSAFGSGGGITNNGALSILNSTVSGNGATGVGGIENNGTATVQNSVVVNNGAVIGGGIFNKGALTLRNSNVNGNSVEGDPAIGGGKGGGMYNEGVATVQNSNINGNSAAADPYGVDPDTGFGGGIYNSSGVVTLQNSEVANNTAGSDGGGVFNNSGTARLKNVSMHDNVPNDCVGCS